MSRVNLPYKGKKRVSTTNVPGATPAMNTDAFDQYIFTGLGTAITSMTSGLTGTPSEGQQLIVSLTDDGTGRAITWGTSFEASTVALPTTTVLTARLDIVFIWDSTTTKWRCVGVA